MNLNCGCRAVCGVFQTIMCSSPPQRIESQYSMPLSEFGSPPGPRRTDPNSHHRFIIVLADRGKTLMID